MIELIVGLPTNVIAVLIHVDDARMLLLAQDGQHEINAVQAWAETLDCPGLTVITRRRD